MNHPARFAAPAVLLLALGIAACGGEEPDRRERSSDSPSATEGTPTETPSDATTEQADPPTTILEYFEQEGIAQTALGPDDDGPVVDLPVLDGWSESDDYSSEASYGALVYDAAADTTQPPRACRCSPASRARPTRRGSSSSRPASCSASTASPPPRRARPARWAPTTRSRSSARTPTAGRTSPSRRRRWSSPTGTTSTCSS